MESISVGIKEVVGLVILSGGGLVGLIKSGLLNVKLGKDAPTNSTSPMTKGDAFKDAEGEAHRQLCKETHSKLDETILGWDKINQTMILEQQEHKGTLKVHREKLEEGTLKMNLLDDKVDNIGQGVAVLLDRTKDK